MESETRLVYADPDATDEVVQGLRNVAGTVTVVETAAGCLGHLSSADCVVLTPPVPDTDLVELCARIDDGSVEVPVIVFPAEGSEALAGDVVAVGADGYVPQSEGIELLATRVGELLDQSTSAPGTDDSPSTSTETDVSARLDTHAALETGSDGSTPGFSPGGAVTNVSATDPADRLEVVVEQSPLAIIEWTPEFEVASWNPAATELFGYTATEADGERGLDLLVPDSDRSEMVDHWEQLLSGNLATSSGWQISQNVCKDGSKLTCEWFNTPLFDDGDVVGVLSFAQDITAERKRANALEALQETTHELMRAESVDEIASIVMDATEHVIDRSLAALRFYDDDTGTLELAAGTSKLEANTGDIARIGPGDDTLWRTYDDGEPVVIDDASREMIPYEIDIELGNATLYPLGDHGLLSVAATGDDDIELAEIHLVHVLAATAEAALDRAARERELEQTKTIVETIGDSVYALDRNGDFITVNDRLTEVTGYDRDELVGEHASTVLTDESVERGRKRVRALVSADEDRIATYELTLVTRDGDRIPCEVNMTLLRSDGVLEGSAGVVRDVSDRKRMERELVEHKAKIERLHEVASQLDDCTTPTEIAELTVEAAADVLAFDVCVVDRAEGEYLVKEAVSASLEGDFHRRIGVDKGIAGMTYRTGETYRFDDVRSVSAAEPGGEEFRSVLSVPIDDWGVFQTVSTEVGAFSREDEDLAELLLSHVTDALDRLTFEQQLRTERDRFAALFENVPDAVVSARQSDGTAIVESVNPAFERVFGYEESTIVDESLDQFIVPTDGKSEAEAVTRRSSRGEIVEAEVKRRTVDGLRDFMLRAVPVEMNETSSRTFGVYTDITDRKQRQKRVEILNRVLRHDMRNGMNIIDGCAEMLAEAVDDDDAEYATTIQERAGELIGLAEKTRAVERVLERESTTVGPIDIADTVAEVTSRLESAYPDVEITSSIPDRTFARTNESLRTALYQILENAVEHNDTSSPTIDISVCDRTDDGMLSVSVADDGPGMPDEERELLQGDREITQLRHTSGLGLWLVNLVVTQSGGQLTFESNEPQGTVVTLEIPQADAELVQSTCDSTATGD
ncbi:PAS domain S-box protein [Natronorubrum sp. FCH18a]|uniref:PAS domain S-box protein n=1 Tax=Natronorubrum sp. FCH18a TaxID=3447018 RepID=UPI003F517E3F